MSEISSTLIAEIQQLLRQAGAMALAGRESAKVQIKPENTPATDVELEIEALFLPFLRTAFPDYALISEENGDLGVESSKVWALDPIDGTKIYLNGLPSWGISLGSVIDGQPGLGFFFMPVTNDMYWGGTGFGAFHNEKKISGNTGRDLSDPLAFITIPANAHQFFDFDYPHLRNFGSTAAHCCYVASGQAEGALLRRVNLWDLAGVLPILSEAGVDVEYISGGKFSPVPYLRGEKIKEEILVARPSLMKQVRAVIQRKPKEVRP